MGVKAVGVFNGDFAPFKATVYTAQKIKVRNIFYGFALGIGYTVDKFIFLVQSKLLL